MSGFRHRYVGKIGYCSNAVLGMKGADGKPLKGGHYVYIREVSGSRCNVNVITSLEDKNGWFQIDKLHKVRRGYLYPIPKDDADFPRWSAVNLDGNVNNVKISDIKSVGAKSMKKRHRFFVGRYTKKK